MSTLNNFLENPELRHSVPDETIVKFGIMLILVLAVNQLLVKVIR